MNYIKYESDSIDAAYDDLWEKENPISPSKMQKLEMENYHLKRDLWWAYNFLSNKIKPLKRQQKIIDEEFKKYDTWKKELMNK